MAGRLRSAHSRLAAYMAGCGWRHAGCERLAAGIACSLRMAGRLGLSGAGVRGGLCAAGVDYLISGLALVLASLPHS